MRLRILAVLFLAVFVVSGCGSSSSPSNGLASKTPQQVVSDASKAATGASAVHVGGHGTSAGEALTLNIWLVPGKGAKGTVTTNGLNFDFVNTDGKIYIRGSKAFFQRAAGSAAANEFHGKWLEFAQSTAGFGAIAPLTKIDSLFKALFTKHGVLKNVGQTTFRGRRAVAIRDTTQGGTLYVAATGQAFPLAVVGGSKHRGTVVFDGWNKPVSITAPAGALDAAKLGG